MSPPTASFSIKSTSGTYVLIEMIVNSICEGHIASPFPAAVPVYVRVCLCMCVHMCVNVCVSWHLKDSWGSPPWFKDLLTQTPEEYMMHCPSYLVPKSEKWWDAAEVRAEQHQCLMFRGRDKRLNWSFKWFALLLFISKQTAGFKALP